MKHSFRSPNYFAKAILLVLLLQTTIVVGWSISTKTIRKNVFSTDRCPTCAVQLLNSAPGLSNGGSRSNSNQQHIKYIFRPIPLHSSSTEVEEVPVPATTNNNNLTVVLSVESYSGLSDREFSLLVSSIEDAYAETLGLDGISCNTTTAVKYRASDDDDDDLLVGSMRRVLSLRTNLDDDIAEYIRASIAQRMDHFIYETGDLRQPVLVSVRTHNECQDQPFATVDAIVKKEIEQYGLRIPIYSDTTTGGGMDNSTPIDDVTMYTPISQIEIDGAETHIDGAEESFWDTSSVVVFDKLVDDDLRSRLLDVVKGKPSANNDWNDVENGPDPNRWIRGGLQDIPDNEEGEEEQQTISSWGLPAEAIADICSGNHDAIQEFELILTNLFPQFVVSRLPEAVYGDCVSPLTANAPVAGEEGIYDYHIDGDPLQTPPSPWTDVYGRYPNRSRGKPRFVSCLLYLNDEWDELKWGAATKFYDPPTDDSYEVTPRPGRCVIIDQDIGHTVTPPKTEAGKRPRYSLVWKLILHPKTENQDMTDLSGALLSPPGRQWPEPELFGSAAAVTRS